jgi:hypothetical protein
MTPFQKHSSEPGQDSQRDRLVNGHLSAQMDRGLASQGGDMGSGFCLRSQGLWSTLINKHLFIELLLCARHCEGHKEALI